MYYKQVNYSSITPLESCHIASFRSNIIYIANRILTFFSSSSNYVPKLYSIDSELIEPFCFSSPPRLRNRSPMDCRTAPETSGRSTGRRSSLCASSVPASSVTSGKASGTTRRRWPSKRSSPVSWFRLRTRWGDGLVWYCYGVLFLSYLLLYLCRTSLHSLSMYRTKRLNKKLF